MTSLRASKVYRAATNSTARQVQTSTCSLTVSDQDETLDISFDVAPRGRGKTRLVLAIGKADLTHMIREAISNWPDLGPALAEGIVGSMAIALEKQRAFQATVAAKALKQLVQVDHRLDALAEEDLTGSAFRKVQAAGNALEAARGTLEAL